MMLSPVPDQAGAQARVLIDGREAGLPDEVMAAEMQHAANALRKGRFKPMTRQ
jgi:hypothetical protein